MPSGRGGGVGLGIRKADLRRPLVPNSIIESVMIERVMVVNMEESKNNNEERQLIPINKDMINNDHSISTFLSRLCYSRLLLLFGHEPRKLQLTPTSDRAYRLVERALGLCATVLKACDHDTLSGPKLSCPGVN